MTTSVNLNVRVLFDVSTQTYFRHVDTNNPEATVLYAADGTPLMLWIPTPPRETNHGRKNNHHD